MRTAHVHTLLCATAYQSEIQLYSFPTHDIRYTFLNCMLDTAHKAALQALLV